MSAYDDTMRITKRVLKTIEPHLPAIVVFGIVTLVLSRAGLTKSIIWTIMAPLVFALITEFLDEARRKAIRPAEASL